MVHDCRCHAHPKRSQIVVVQCAPMLTGLYRHCRSAAGATIMLTTIQVSLSKLALDLIKRKTWSSGITSCISQPIMQLIEQLAANLELWTTNLLKGHKFQK